MIKIHIDKVSIGIFCHKDTVISFLKERFKVLPDIRMSQKDNSNPSNTKVFKRIKKFSNGVDLFYDRKNKSFGYVNCRLFLHDPTPEILTFIHDKLTSIRKKFTSIHVSNYSLTEVEYAFDFYTIHSEFLCRILWENIAVPNSRFKPFQIKDTRYFNNPRRTQTKAIRIYPKKDSDGNSFARVEFVIKRRRVKALSLNLKLEIIDKKFNWRKYLFFSALDKRKLNKHFYRIDKTLFNDIEQRRKGFGNLILLQNDSFVDCLCMYYPLSEQKERLKELGISPNRFFSPITTFDVLFNTHHGDTAFPLFIPIEGLLHEYHANLQ